MAEGGPPAATSSSYSNSDVNEQFLSSLMEMGIHRDLARQVFFLFCKISLGKFLFQALKIVNNRSLEDALAVVFGETSLFSTESSTSVNGANVEQPTRDPYQSVGYILISVHLITLLNRQQKIRIKSD